MIRVNGKERAEFPPRLLDLLAESGLDAQARGVAVAVNGAVVMRARWSQHCLADGDEVEIVKVLQGG